MTDYSKMSDVEISLAVGKLVSRDGISVIGHNGKAHIHHYSEPTETIGALCLGWKEVDYCNSWADAGPIAEKKGITISAPMKYDDPALWLAYPASNSDLCVASENPCRAICIVFLMMNEGE